MRAPEVDDASFRPSAQVPRPANFVNEAETDMLAYMTCAEKHCVKLHSTNPIERLISAIKRCTGVICIFPNKAAITRLVGAILLKQNDERAIQQAT